MDLNNRKNEKSSTLPGCDLSKHKYKNCEKKIIT